MPTFTVETRLYADAHPEEPWVIEARIGDEPEWMIFRFPTQEERDWAHARLQEAGR